MRIGVGVETARHELLRPNPFFRGRGWKCGSPSCDVMLPTGLVKTEKRRCVPMQMCKNGLSIEVLFKKAQQLLRCCSMPSCHVNPLHICTQMNTNSTAPPLSFYTEIRHLGSFLKKK